MNREVRKLQPVIIINNRSLLPEDLDTPEQHITPTDRPWESCMTMCDTWGYHAGDDNYNSTATLIRNLVDCCSGGGNLLLNVGPRPDGTFPAPARKRLAEIGEWMDLNSQSIYGTTRSPFEWGNCHTTTVKGSTVYLHVVRWPGEELCVTGIANKVTSASLLADGAKLRVRQEDDRLFIGGLPKRPPDKRDTVIKLTVKGTPEKSEQWVRMR